MGNLQTGEPDGRTPDYKINYTLHLYVKVNDDKHKSPDMNLDIQLADFLCKSAVRQAL